MTAVLAGLVFCLPDLMVLQHRKFYQRHFPEAVSQWMLGGRFTSIAPYDDPDANLYAARAHEAARHFWPMDANVKENRSRRLAVSDTLSFMFLGAMERLTGDISRAWLLARGLCGMMWIATLYLLIAELAGKKRVALSAAVAITLFYDLIVDPLWPIVASFQQGLGVIPPAFRSMAIHAFWLLGKYQANFGASRIMSPGLNTPPFFFAAYCAWRAARGATSWAVVGGIVGGAMAYIHPDVWHIYMAAMGLFSAVWSLRQKAFVWPLWTSAAITFVLSLPWIAFNYPMDPEILARSGGELTHAPVPFGFFLLAAAALCLWRLGKDAGSTFCACVMAACFFAVECQILTGRAVYPMRFIILGVTVGLIVLAGALGRRAQESRHWLWLTALTFMLGAGRIESYAAQRYPYQGLPRDIELAFIFLNQNTPNDSVVVSLGPQETMLIPVYTHNKTFIGHGFNLTCDIPLAELFGRIRTAASLYAIPIGVLNERLASPGWQHPKGPEYLTAGMEPAVAALWNDRVDWQAQEWSNFSRYYLQTFRRSEVIERLEEAPPVGAEADYLWLGPFERGLMSDSALKKLGHPIYENSTVSLYKVS